MIDCDGFTLKRDVECPKISTRKHSSRMLTACFSSSGGRPPSLPLLDADQGGGLPNPP